jgi:chromosome segregation ATPase
MKSLKFLSIGICVLGLGACNGSTDPATAGLFDNVRNLNSGEYDRQIASNRSQAAAILANNQAAEARIRQMDAQRGANAQQIASLRAQVAGARSDAAAARARVGGDSARLQRISALERQTTSVEREVSAGTADPSVASGELRRIRAALGAI